MDLSQGNTTDSIFRQSTGFCRLSFFCSVLLPYIPYPMRQPLLLFTKFLELKECISCPMKRFDFGQAQAMDSADAMSDIFAKLSPFLSEPERAQFSQMQNMMQMLKLYQTFQELAPMMNMGGDGNSQPDMGTAYTNMANILNMANMANNMPFDMNNIPNIFSQKTNDAPSGTQTPDSAFYNTDTSTSDPYSTNTPNTTSYNADMTDSAPNTTDTSTSATDNTTDNTPDSGFADGGMADMLFSMLSPDQKEMFENLKTVMSEPPAE